MMITRMIITRIMIARMMIARMKWPYCTVANPRRNGPPRGALTEYTISS